MAKLTPREIMLLHAIDIGVSRPRCGWLDQIADRLARMVGGEWAEDDKAVLDVFESLLQRGAVKATKVDGGVGVNYWVGEPAS